MISWYNILRRITIAHQVTLEEAATHLPELVREAHRGQEIIFTQGIEPVAKLVPVGDDTPSDCLADEPNMSPVEPADRIASLLRQWQHQFGLPPRPDGKIHTSVEELFAQWEQEDALLTPEEAEAARQIWEDCHTMDGGVSS